MRTIKLTLSYDGTGCVGWQIQPRGTSIQGLVQRALKTLTGEETSVIAAGRTDAGVHALAQVAHFVTKSKIPSDGVRKGLDSLLPPNVSVIDAADAPDGFHARKDAKGKLYRYLILVSRDRAPLLAGRCWQMQDDLDAEAMRRAAVHLVGEHDFSSFRASGCTSRHARRAIRRIDIAKIDAKDLPVSGEAAMLRIDFEGDGFVRHMIRNITGTLVEVGLRRMSPKDVLRILKAKRREEAGRCAPACGLYLVEVFY